MSSFESSKRSHAAYKGHFTMALKSFYALMEVKPHPTVSTVDQSYSRVQNRMDAIFSSSEKLLSSIQSGEFAAENIDATKELDELNKYCDKILQEQCKVETLYATFIDEYKKSTHSPPTPMPIFPPAPVRSKPTVRLTALEPPSWNGIKADFYTWKKKFIHIMSEANIPDELTQLCYLQHSRTLPITYQGFLSDCSTMTEAWSRLEERIPKETIKYEIITQFRRMKPLPVKKTPSMLRDFANEISLFCRRMADIGFTKESYSCIIMQDVYERMDLDTTLRYRSKIELKRELGNAGVYEDPDSLSNFLRSEATTLELATGSSEIRSYPPKKFNVLQSSNIPTEEKSNEYERQPCVLGCMKIHKLIDCETYLGMTVEKRHEFIKSASRCFVCLGIYHRAQKCPRKRENWKCRYCSGNTHHWTLCTKQHDEALTTFNALSPSYHPVAENTINCDAEKTQVTHSISAMSLSAASTCKDNGYGSRENDNVKPKDYSAVVLVEVKNRYGSWITATCFLDTGSNSSLVRLKFAKDLQLYGNGPANVEFGTAGGSIHYERAEDFEMQIRPIGKEESYSITATGVKKPCFDVRPITSEILSKYKHLEEFNERVFTNGGQIDILIGLEYAPLIIPERIVRAVSFPDDSPSIAITRLGCYLYGSLHKSPRRIINNVVSINHINKFEEDELNLFFYGDVIGVKPTSLCVCTDNQIAESAFIKHVKKTTHINEDGRVCVDMPWKPGFPENLPNNLHSAIGQMIRRENQLIKNGKLDLYNAEISDLVKRQVVKILSPIEARKALVDPSWYLNHRLVERPDKETTKLRIVFDSAAVYKGICLNDAFEKGPDYTNSLFRCFLRWRMHQVAVTGDMQKMFNQIAMAEKDQKYHRFVWRDGDSSQPATVYQWMRVLFGDKPSPDLATYAIRFLAEKYIEMHPAGANILENSTYVDDIVFSEPEHTKVTEIINEIDEVLQFGKFSIKVWNSNNPNVDQNPDEVTVDVLGHRWDKASDIIGMKHKSLVIESDKKFTKRNIVSAVSKLWDPFGYLLPVSIKYRIDLQKIWRHKYGWDEPIDRESVELWKENLNQMELLVDIDVRRCFKPIKAAGPPQLHAFSDGGDQAYGTCIFLRWPTSDGIEIVFIAAKAFVAPLKYKTTPRLELMAAVAMARLTREIETALDYPFEFKTFWIDSKVVIFWLLSLSSKYKSFVASRIQEFQDCFENYKDEIRYVPSGSNPADRLTKPISVSDLISWHKGEYCEFLKSAEESWPSDDANDFDTTAMKSLLEEKPKSKSDIKRQKSKRPVQNILLNKILDGPINMIAASEGREVAESECLGFQLAETFSSWQLLVRSVSFLKRSLKLRSFDCNFESTPLEINSAETTLFFLCQQVLRSDINGTRKRFIKYNAVYDEQGIIRAKGRLEKVELPEKLKHPILLPAEHPLVKLYATYHHRKLLHQGYRVILAFMAGIGVIVGGGKELLKGIASRCMFCRIRRRKLLQQQMGVLPPFRIAERKAPFTSVAIDFFGNLKVKQSRNINVNGSVLIVTCLTTRCIHLELCITLDTNTFLRAWRRFASLRGVHPNHVFSDGGTTFRGAHSPLSQWIEAWDHHLIRKEFEQTKFDFAWEFNVPTASHMNGAVESLIHSVRKGLDAAIVNYTTKTLTYEEWTTVLAEVTYVVNSRPLFPDGDPWEFNCITGNSLLYPYDHPNVPQFVPEEKFNPRDILKVAQQKVDCFWNTWIKHMPPQLNCRNKWYHPRENLEKGDYVIVLEKGLKGASAPRSMWKKGIVTDTYRGTDGLVRSVKIRDSNHREYDRPIHKLSLIATRAELEEEL